MPNKQSAETFYDDFAAKYDTTIQDPATDVQHINEAKKIFDRYGHNAGRLLDIGCGTGLFGEMLGSTFDCTGIDISQKMLTYAEQRGYTVFHQSIESALDTIENDSFDFVVALGSLLFVEDIQPVMEQMRRIATRSILLSFDVTTPEFIEQFVVPVYDHSQFSFLDAKEDYCIHGWISPITGIPIETRMVYIPKSVR